MKNETNDQIIVYEPNQKAQLGFFRSWLVMIQNLMESRELIWQLFKRDFLFNYKQSLFGILWIIISPVLGIVSWVFMNAMGILKPGDVGVPYPVYVLVGTTLWGFFLSLYSAAAGSLASGGSLIIQIKFAHEALVVQQVAQSLANFLVNLLIIMLVLLVLGIIPGWKVLLFPLMLIPLFCIGTGIGMIVAVITIVIHDINKIVSMGLGFLMFLTPVIYAPSIQNKSINTIIQWNPMTHLIGGARDIIIYGKIDNLHGYIYSCILAVLIFMFSWKLFFLSENKVAEKL